MMRNVLPPFYGSQCNAVDTDTETNVLWSCVLRESRKISLYFSAWTLWWKINLL